MGKKQRQFRILQKRSGEWINLYPAVQGQLPEAFAKTDAEEKVKRMAKMFGIEFKIVPAKKALKHEIPKRW